MTEAIPGALPLGTVIGILGGGQLARMLSVAAGRLGYRTHVFDPDPAAPAAHLAAGHTVAGYDDAEALRAFAARVGVVTYEFENVPAGAARLLDGLCPLRPGPRALEIAQDRLTEKAFLAEAGLPPAPHLPVESAADLEAALRALGRPAILKSRRMGYDGKGQARIGPGEDAAAAWAAIGEVPAVLEAFVPFEREISVIVARGLGGEIATYPPGENTHDGGILRRTRVPATVSPALAEEARAMAARLAEALGYVGTLGLELFVTGEGLLANEFAPRVHNSGHWTQDACTHCQFEQHIRAIAGWPLGPTAPHSAAEMENLIGHDLDRLPALAREGASIHLYGKAEVRAGRKMGHVNRLLPGPPP
jgi:5-(carboxyamino)imidazole ribonucleotide synthase